MSARSMIVPTVRRSARSQRRVGVGTYSRKIDVPEPIVDVHQEENDSGLR